jgi:hypothetical protein
MQNFINDLIKTVEAVEERGCIRIFIFFLLAIHVTAVVNQEDPQRTVQTFIDLIQRHEQAFYNFVHKVHSKGEGLFDGLMRWVELFLTVVREGLGDPISLEFLLPHTGQERANILAEVDAVALYHYKLKVAYEDKIRRRFGKVQGQSGADAEDEATQALVQGVVGEISFGELVTGDAVDIAAEETDESDESSSEYETDSDETDDSSEEHSAAPPAPPPKHVVTRSQTVAQSARPPQYTSSDASSARPRSLSLKSSRSMTFSFSGRSSRTSQDLPPPVPALPKGQPMSAITKPLPQSPRSFRPRHHSSTDNLPLQAPLKSSRKGKKAEALKPPELHHIPQLLPVFKEMVRLII